MMLGSGRDSKEDGIAPLSPLGRHIKHFKKHIKHFRKNWLFK